MINSPATEPGFYCSFIDPSHADDVIDGDKVLFKVDGDSMAHAVIIRYTTALLMLLALSVGAQVDVYKCVVNGVTTYSDSPCGGHAEKINISAETPVQKGIG